MAEELLVVASGQPKAIIAIADEADTFPPQGDLKHLRVTTEGAAEELINHIKQISGATLPLRKLADDELEAFLEECRKAGFFPIFLGSIAHRELNLAHKSDSKEGAAGFHLKVTAELAAIAGEDPTATAYGVYELLEQVGVRWFFPGKLGTVIPSTPNIAFKKQQMVAQPKFKGRYFPVPDIPWMKRQRMGGPFFPSSHGIPLGTGVTAESHPNLFALVKGERKEPQVCISEPEVLKRAVGEIKAYFTKNPDMPWYGIGPADGSGFCECEKCQALDGEGWDPFSNEHLVTDRYIWFFNQILEQLEDEYPSKKLAFYAYHTYMLAPTREIPNPRIVPAIAPIALCRIHGLTNPVCPERSFLKTVTEGWKKVVPEIYERGYWFNLADPGMLFIQTHKIKDEIAFYAEQGITGFRTECTGQWAAEGPSLYIAGKLLWDPTANTDLLLADFCEKLFGPAAQPMISYFTLLDQRLAHTDHHSGSAFNILHFYPQDVLAQADTYLKQAEQLASEGVVRERVQIFREGFEYTKVFAEMNAARDRHDWKQAFACLEEMDALRNRLLEYEAPMLQKYPAESFLRRFFRLPVEQGYAKTTGGNRLVAPLGDQWESLIDPQRVGTALHYENPTILGGNWQSTPSYSTTWGDIGLRYYKGLAWYRQDVEIPKEFEGARVFLWFGGVDETARIWVNGKEIGTSPISAFTPFEVDATEAIRAGEKARVVVCVANELTNELGLGGITAPGFFYAPAKGAQAVLENAKPLRNTFP